MSTSEPTVATSGHQNVEVRTTAEVRIGAWTVDDGAAVWELVRASTLDDNSPYAYLLWGDHFSATSRVARDGNGLVGFVMGYRPPAQLDTLFIWQVGVDPRVQGRGLASTLIDHVWTAHDDLAHLESTVTPSNGASDHLFRAFAERHDAPVETSLAYSEHQFPPGGHEAEIRYQIGPVSRH